MTLIIFLILFFVGINALIFLSLRSESDCAISSQNQIQFSIIIAGKNEENNLENLFSALHKLEYDKNKLEVIFVDDNSTDNTYNLAVQISCTFSNFRIIKCTSKPFAGKKGALAVGIQSAKFPFILITDADCIPENGWLNSFSNCFNNRFDFVLGVAPFYQSTNNINKISCFENLRSSILTFAFTKLKFPYTASARNFGFRKEAFIKIGGYSNTTETLSGDDDLLLREAIKNKLKIGCVTNRSSWVFSNSKIKLKDYLNQKARHTETSLHYLFSRQIVLGLWHLINLIMILGPLLFFLNQLFLLLFLTKMTVDIFLIKSFDKKFGYTFQFFEIISLQIVYDFFLIINFFNAFTKKIEWK